MQKHQKIFFIIIFLCLAASNACLGYEVYVNTEQVREDLNKIEKILENENVCGKDNLETIITHSRNLLDQYDNQPPEQRKKDNLFDFMLNTKKFMDFTIDCNDDIENKNWEGTKVHLKNMNSEINRQNKLKNDVKDDGYDGADDIVEFMYKIKEHCADSEADYLKARAEKSPTLSGKRDYWVIIVDIYDSAGINDKWGEEKKNLNELIDEITNLKKEAEEFENTAENHRNEADKTWWILSFRRSYDRSVLNYNEAIKKYEQIGKMDDEINEMKKTISDVEMKNGVRTKNFIIKFILFIIFIATIIIVYMRITRDIRFERKYDKSVKIIWGKQ